MALATGKSASMNEVVLVSAVRTSIGAICGGHIDVAIMGGLEVDERANHANWAVPGQPLLGVGGAMHLAVGAKRLIITMQHTNPDGSAKIVPACMPGQRHIS